MERRSRNTQENAEFSKALVAPKDGERWLLASSAFHMPRSVGLFRKAGFAVEPYPVDWRVGGRDDLMALSNVVVEGLARTDLAVREWMGLIAYGLTGKTDELLPGPASRSKRSQPPSSRATIGRSGIFSAPIGSLCHATADTAGSVRFGRHGGRPQQSASPEDDRVRHEAVREARGDGGDPAHPPAENVHTLDQIVGQAARLGWTIGITADDLVGAQCRAVVGLGNAKDEAWRSGKHMVGVWYSTNEDAARAPGGDGMRAGRALRGAGVVAAVERPARPARYRAVLRHARRDDLFHQRAAMGRLQALRLERRRRVGLRRIPGAGR